MDPEKHDAHVRALRLAREAAWLAGRKYEFRISYLARVERKKGREQRVLLARMTDEILAPRRIAAASRMDEVRKAVFG